MQCCIQLHIDIKIISYLQGNPYRMETKTCIRVIFNGIITKKLMSMIFFAFRLFFVFSERKEKGLLYIDALSRRIKMFHF